MPTIKVLKLKGRTLFCYLGYRKIYKICWLFSDGNLCMCLYSVGSGNTENPMYTYRLFCFVIKQFSCKGYFHQLIKIYLPNIILLYKIFPIHFSVCFFGYSQMHRPSALEEEITWSFVVSLNFQSGSELLSPAVDFENHCDWNRREEMLDSFPLYVLSWSWKQAEVSHTQGTMRRWKWWDVNSLTFQFPFFYSSCFAGTRRAYSGSYDHAAPWKGRHCMRVWFAVSVSMKVTLSTQ